MKVISSDAFTSMRDGPLGPRYPVLGLSIKGSSAIAIFRKPERLTPTLPF